VVWGEGSDSRCRGLLARAGWTTYLGNGTIADQSRIDILVARHRSQHSGSRQPARVIDNVYLYSLPVGYIRQDTRVRLERNRATHDRTGNWNKSRQRRTTWTDNTRYTGTSTPSRAIHYLNATSKLSTTHTCYIEASGL